MAKHGGMPGGISGKVGTVVGGSWNGINYLRSLPAPKATRKLSELQLERQVKFALGMLFIRAMGELPAVSFQKGMGRTAKNSMQGRLLSQAIGGRYPGLFIDYSQVDIARGELKKAAGARAVTDGEGSIRFTWTDNTGMGNAAATDLAILVAYNPGTNDMIWTPAGGTRSAQSGLLDAGLFSGREVHTWLSFRTLDGKRVADSCYLGVLRVS